MSLQENTNIRFQGENGAEYTLIATPVSGGDGEVLHQAILQQLGNGIQSADGNTQVLMLHPITVTTVDGIEHQILQDQSIGQMLADGALQIQTDGQVIQTDGHVLQADGQVLQADTQVLHTDGQVLQADGQVLEGHMLSETSQAQIQALLQEANLVSLNVSSASLATGSTSSVAYYTAPEHLVSSTDGITTQTLMLQTADGQSFQAQVSIPQVTEAAVTTVQPEPAVQPPLGKGPFHCEICSKVFVKWNQLQRHLRDHNDDKPFRCPDCPLTFNVSDNLRLHMATHSTGNPQCPECGKKFSRIASLKAHIMLHEKEESLMCAECGDEFALQGQLDRHMQEHQDEKDGVRVFSCRQCTVEFPLMSQLREHMKQHYKVKNSLSHKTYKRNLDRSGFHHKCNHCSKTFQKPSQLIRHLRIHTGERPYRCEMCEKRFNQKGALQIHMSKHNGERPFPCQFCPATFSQKGNLRSHIQRLHSHPTSTDTPIFQCDECSCMFRKLGSLNAHLSRVHSDGGNASVLKVRDSTTTEEGSVVVMKSIQEKGGRNVQDVIQQLLELSDVASDPQATQQQLQQIAVSENISSDILQQALENSGLAIQSVDGVPTNGSATVGEGGDASGSENQTSQVITLPVSTISQCGYDGKPGETSTMTVHDPATGTIKKHLIRKVNGIRLHQCTYCAKEFKKPSDLVRHIRIHTHERPYKCTQCFRSFAVKSTLMVHMRTHSGIKEFKCSVCNKLLSTNGSLKVHMRLHTGHKPFQCPHCDKWFRTSGHRKCHVASHFKDPTIPRKLRRNPNKKSRYEGNLSDIPLPEPILITDSGMIQQAPRHNAFYNSYLCNNGSSTDRPFKCNVCARAFKKSSHLKQHIRSHTGERPYKCIQCSRAFVSSGVLKAHIKTHSGIKAHKCHMCDATFTTAGSLKRHTSTHSEVRPFMCPYCQKTFKTSVNCKKHMRTHRAELALQSLNQGALLDKDGQPQEVTLITEVEVAADNVIEEEDDNVSDADVGESIEIQAVGDDMVLSETEQSTNVLTLQHEHLQTKAIQDALVNDAQLGTTLNPQVFMTQALTQTYTQSLLSNSNQTFNQLDYSNIQTSASNALDSSLTNFSQAESTPTTIVSTSMHNILQTKEPEELPADPEDPEEEIQPSQQILRPRIQLEDNVEKQHKFVCSHCGRPFKKSSHLKQHVRSHTGEKPYACGQCGRTFVSNGVLKAHLKTHVGTKDYKCDICGWTFSTKGSLTRHRMIHTSLKPFKCPFCNETFRTAFHCKKHMRSHREGDNAGGEELTENGTPIMATKRSRSVVQISEEQAMELVTQTEPNDEATALSLKLLMESAVEKNRISEAKDALVVDEETHSSSRNKFPHQCAHCPKSFKKPSDLTRHVRIHTGEKPYGCATCGRTFTVKSTLDSHMRTHRAMEKQFKCHMCNNAFSTKGSLKVHMRLHTGAKPFKCPHCDLRFRTSGHRKSHIALHFKETADGLVRKRKIGRQSDLRGGQGVTLLSNPSIGQGNQVITLDPSMFGGVMPMQLSILDGGGLAIANPDSGLGTQVLQGLEGLQLQVTANIGGQNIQISGLDPSVLTQTQTVQIDASLLQQLQQQQGNVNLAVNPNIITQNFQPGESNIIELQGSEMNNLLQQPAGQDITVNDVVSAVSHVQQVEESLNTSETAIIPENIETEEEHHSQQQSLQEVLTDGEVIEDEIDSEDDDEGTMIAEGVTEETLKTLQQAGISLVNQDGTPVSVTTKDGNQQIIFTSVSSDGKPTQIVNILPSRDGERAHVCNKCGKSFKRPSHLREHMMTHNPNQAQRIKQALHRCQTCQKAFTKPSQLERHIRIHTGERPFTCSICYRAFNQKNALQMHMKKHSGERPHQCPYCTHSFTQKGNLKTHIKRAHHVEMVQSMNLPKSTSLDTSMMVDVALAAAAAERGDETEGHPQSSGDEPTAGVSGESAGHDEGIDLDRVVEWLPN